MSRRVWALRGTSSATARPRSTEAAVYFYEPILGNMYRTYGNRTPPLYQQANIRRPPFPNPLGGALVPLNRLDLFVFEPDNPYRVQYNVTVQRQLLPEMVVTVGYVGSRGHHQIRNIEGNQAVPEILADGRYFFPLNSPRRNPNFESIRLRTTDGQSEYNGMVLGVSKRFKQGLAFQASYTLGKSMDDGSQAIGSSDFSNSFQPRYGPDPADNWGPSDFDIRHNFVFNYSYELPLAADAHGFVQALAGGWQISGIVTMLLRPSVHADARGRSRPCPAPFGRRGSAAELGPWLQRGERDPRRDDALLRSERVRAPGVGVLRRRAAQCAPRSELRLVGRGALQEPALRRTLPDAAAARGVQHPQPRELRLPVELDLQLRWTRRDGRRDHRHGRNHAAVPARDQVRFLRHRDEFDAHEHVIETLATTGSARYGCWLPRRVGGVGSTGFRLFLRACATVAATVVSE